MPAEQRGQVYATAKGYGIRWYDERGARRRQAGFSSPSKARAWFRDVELPRMRGGLVDEPLTLREFSDRYLARYESDRAAVTVQTLKWRLVRSLDEFGDVELSKLRAGEIAAWEATLPPRFRYALVRALRQVLDAAVAWEYLARNPAKATGKNPAPSVVERIALEPGDVDKLAVELGSPFDAAVVVGAWTFLRPSELLALERAMSTGTSCTFEGRSTVREGRRRVARQGAPSAPSRCPSERVRRSPDSRRGSTPGSCSLGRPGTPTTSATSAVGSSIRRGSRQGSTRRSRRTRSGTPGSRGRWPLASHRQTLRGSEARASPCSSASTHTCWSQARMPRGSGSMRSQSVWAKSRPQRRGSKRREARKSLQTS